MRSQQHPCSRSRRRGAAALLVALVVSLATSPAATAAPATRGEHFSGAKGDLAQAQCRVGAPVGAPEDKPVPLAEAASDDGLPVVPLVVGLLIFGGVSALLVRRHHGRLDSN